MDNYMIILIFQNNIENIDLKKFNKNKITFGSSTDNDIVIPSKYVSKHHGYFEIIDNTIRIVDNHSTNGIFVNDKKIDTIELKNNDSIKIDNPDINLEAGVTMILNNATNNDKEKWQHLTITDNHRVTIGRKEDNDIVLTHISVNIIHAFVYYKKQKCYIEPYKNSVISVNNHIIDKATQLNDRDVILIANFKLVYQENAIYYPSNDIGLSLDAVDISKVVKVNRKKKFISYHVDMSIKAGEFVAFVGGSGAGKSTFMNCINGIDKPTSGSVYINGNELYSNYSVLKNVIGYVPQADIIHDELTLIDMLKYAANLRMPDDSTVEEKEKRIEEVLDIVELKTRKKVLIKNLSGGQKKRASIAVELLADPKLFFLDEPTSGLDPGTERSIMKTLRKMANTGKTIILVTHTTLNLNLCDKIAFFGTGGKLCFYGSPEETLKFFNVDDFVDIYNLTTNNPDRYYKLYNSNLFKREHNKETNEKKNLKTSQNKKSFFKQLSTLTGREINKLIHNRQQLMLLILQAPIIAYLLKLVVKDTVFTNYDEAKTFLFCLATASMWLGLLNSIQEICKERVILKKEYMADLKLSAYLLSKLIIQCILGFIQAFLLIFTLKIFIDIPENGVVYSWELETFFTCFITIISAAGLGFVVSSIARNSSTAMSFAPILLVPQLLFSGMLFQLEGITDYVSNIILCRWSVEALGTINNLNSLPNTIQTLIPYYTREEEAFYEFTATHLFNDIGIMLLMLLVLMIFCYIILKRQLEK